VTRLRAGGYGIRNPVEKRN